MTEPWAAEYRASHPRAAEWARGYGTVCHGEQTQSRIFRMAEQLRASFDWPSAEPLFTVLIALDRGLDPETAPGRAPKPSAVAAAATVTCNLLLGAVPHVDDRGWPVGFEQVTQTDVPAAAAALQRKGYDPIVIDGTDPAAYVWALFEMKQRQASCADVNRLHQYRPQPPRCLAVVPAGAWRQAPSNPAIRVQGGDVVHARS